MKKTMLTELATAPAAATAAPAAGVPAAGGKKLGSSAQKLQARLAKIQGLDQLMSTVERRNDAAEILAAIAEKLGGDKIAGSKALTDALKIAKEEEKLNEQAEERIQAFVRYLFEYHRL